MNREISSGEIPAATPLWADALSRLAGTQAARIGNLVETMGRLGQAV